MNRAIYIYTHNYYIHNGYTENIKSRTNRGTL